MKFDFIPLELYTIFYYYTLMFVVIVTFFKLQEGFKKDNFGIAFVLTLIIYMGFRPLSGRYFGDMSTYNLYFTDYTNGGQIRQANDLFFHVFMKALSNVMTADFFFLTCAFLYTYPLYLVCKKWFKEYWFYAFLMLVVSFSFWGAGVNGIRNGIAGSVFLLAISRDKRIYQIALLVLAISFHKTILLPTLGFVIAQFYNKPKFMITFWILCIPLSLAAGGFWETFFATLGFEDDRLAYLTEGNANSDQFSSTGFRWDFLAFSSTAVFAGWYFIVKKKFVDKMYFSLFNIYVFANAFWILVIRANFSNRFAYLSWFLMGLVIAYPFLKSKLIKGQNRIFAIILVLYFLFTYVMNVLLKK